MNREMFFVSSAPLLTSTYRLPAIGPRRPPFMGAGGNVPPSSDNGDGYTGRFREFTSQGGDTALQDDLVREVLWQATRTATTETMESAIQDELDAVSDMLADMYSRGERNLRSRHEELARRTSLPNISKWNQTLIESHKMSKETRSEIDKELAIVDELLRRNRRAQKRQRRAPSLIFTKSRRHSEQNGLNLEAIKDALGPSSTPAGLLFTAAVCATAMESFENIAAQPNGPSNLAKYAAISALLVLMAAHLQAVRAAARAANDEISGRGATISPTSQEEKS